VKQEDFAFPCVDLESSVYFLVTACFFKLFFILKNIKYCFRCFFNDFNILILKIKKLKNIILIYIYNQKNIFKSITPMPYKHPSYHTVAGTPTSTP